MSARGGAAAVVDLELEDEDCTGIPSVASTSDERELSGPRARTAVAGVVGLRQRCRHQTGRYPVCASCQKRLCTLLCTRMHLRLLLVVILAMLDLAYSDFDFGFMPSLVAFPAGGSNRRLQY